MEIIIRILVALGIVFFTGLVIGILWGLYIGERKERKEQKRKQKVIKAWDFIRKNSEKAYLESKNETRR
jgi:cbb3-type cytochrome oxidase subunit 3